MKTFSMFMTLAAMFVAQAGAQVPPQCNIPVSCGDFNAYELKKATDGTANVCTEFACGDVVVQRIRRLIVPIGALVGQHYLAYELRSETYDESANPSSVNLQTLYGSTTQNLQKPAQYLIVPANKSIPPDANPPVPATTDGFLCFKPSNTGFGMSNQTVVDQFGSQDYTIHKVSYTCISAGINSPAPATTTYLLGIAAKLASMKFIVDVNVTDLFHPAGFTTDVDPVDELLATATVTP